MSDSGTSYGRLSDRLSERLLRVREGSSTSLEPATSTMDEVELVETGRDQEIREVTSIWQVFCLAFFLTCILVIITALGLCNSFPCHL